MDEHSSDDGKNLPATIEDQTTSESRVADGFDYDDDDAAGSGFGIIEKFVDGEWSTGGLPVDRNRRLVVIGTDTNIRRWKDKKLFEVFVDKPLPNLKMLNESVPKSEWEIGLKGEPRPPYERVSIVHLLDLNTAERTTFASSSIGAGRAVHNLRDKVVWMRRLKNNNNIVPQVELSWAPFPTRYGMKKRPDFKIVGWYDLSPAEPKQLPPTTEPKQLPTASGPKQAEPVTPKQVVEPSTREMLDDEIPF